MTPPLVLVVDHDPAAGARRRVQMELDGYRVSVASDGASAMLKAQAESPDLIVLDAQLPDTDGFLVAQLLNASDATRHVPIIMADAADERQLRLRVRSLLMQEEWA